MIIVTPQRGIALRRNIVMETATVNANLAATVLHSPIHATALMVQIVSARKIVVIQLHLLAAHKGIIVLITFVFA